MRRLAGLILALLLTAGCGGGASSSAPVSSPPVTGGGSTGEPSPSAGVHAVQAVTAVTGANTGGVDITVAAPAASNGPNAEMLGVSDVNTATTARNSGATVRRGSTAKVVLFGRALDGSLRVTIGGPADITVSNIRSVTASDGTAGIAFDVSVSGGAALGARTVFLRSPNDDITAFTGGLEVVP